MSSSSLLDLLQPGQWPLLVLISARIGGMMLVAPIWSSGLVPVRVRAAIALALTVFLFPLVGSSALPGITVAGIAAPLVTEAFIGFAIGLTAATMLYAVTVVAEVISLQMGLSLGAAFGGPSESGTPGIGQFYHQLFLLIYLATGGATAMVRTLAESFVIIRPGGQIAIDGTVELLSTLGGSIFTTAIAIAGPVIVALLLANLALAVLNRAIPQLNTMMVAVPLTIAVGLIALGGILPLTTSLMATWASRIPANTSDLVTSLSALGAP